MQGAGVSWSSFAASAVPPLLLQLALPLQWNSLVPINCIARLDQQDTIAYSCCVKARSQRIRHRQYQDWKSMHLVAVSITIP